MNKCEVKSKTMLCGMLLAFALISSIFFTNQMTHAQNTPNSSHSSQPAQQPATQRSDQNAARQTFTGFVAKSGDRLVLTDPLTKTSYQLDDQRRARELVNKNVKVTGVLDPSTGTIRVSAIEPN